MADNIIGDFLDRAKGAKGDPEIQAALAADFAVATIEPEQPALRASLDAAATLHWFDANLLKRMLELSAGDAGERLDVLKSLPFVERYREKPELLNVHEATRLGWRRRLAHTKPDLFHSLSRNAAACFAQEREPIARIEYIYHFLCGDPERGASELDELSRDWIIYAHGRPEHYYALSAAMRELADSGLVQGRARARQHSTNRSPSSAAWPSRTRTTRICSAVWRGRVSGLPA